MATLLCPRATCLRSLASITRVTPATIAKSPFSTNAWKQLQSSTRPTIVCRPPPSRATLAVRNASSATSTAASTGPPADVLTWDRFFAVRRRKRYINLAVSIVTAGATVVVVGPLLAQQDIDTWGAQISGIDPMFVLGISTLTVAAGGWLCGPSLGSAMFGVWAARRGWAKAIQGKEKSFYRRIQKYRADPSSSSPQNPIPDYYGEKVASVKDYRRWLKDQRAFKLKKNKNLF
ncbi:TIM23 complex component [Elasticomyces elasticus]|nr:TIM23 complex component [Elasticomyces elasticus]